MQRITSTTYAILIAVARITFAADPAAAVAEKPVSPPAAQKPDAAPTQAAQESLIWNHDYSDAITKATAEGKMLLVYFQDSGAQSLCPAFEKKTLADAKITAALERFVLAKVPTNAQIIMQGKQVTLLKHPAFAEMLGRPGVAIVDLTDKKSPNFHQVVSVLPFTSTKYTTVRALSTLVNLPPGTLTQRTMVFAVRMHPEAPASTTGNINPTLVAEANSHSVHQASIHVQGHHQWDQRFHRINSRLPSGLHAQEVVAESWPNENLLEACEDCVHSWRQSPGHWGAVRARQPLFGYDIRRGRNGIWYATGLFGQR